MSAQPKHDPFRVWLSTTNDITDEWTTHVSTEPIRNADSIGVVILAAIRKEAEK